MNQLHRAGRTAASPGTGTAASLDQFLRSSLFLFFRARAVGETLAQSLGLSTGKWSLLRSVKEEGPQTVAEIARARPVARQGVQRMADQLEREGLIEYVDNPAHRRAKLVRLSARGEQTLGTLEAAFGPLLDRIAAFFSEAEIKTAYGATSKLSEIFEALLSAPDLKKRVTEVSARFRGKSSRAKTGADAIFDTSALARGIEDRIHARLKTR